MLRHERRIDDATARPIEVLALAGDVSEDERDQFDAVAAALRAQSLTGCRSLPTRLFVGPRELHYSVIDAWPLNTRTHHIEASLAAQTTLQVCDAVWTLQSQGLCHGAIGPAVLGNATVDSSGVDATPRATRAAIHDLTCCTPLGRARTAKLSSVARLSPEPPEVARNSSLTATTDVWSAAVLLWYLCNATDPRALRAAIPPLARPPRLDHYPAELDHLLNGLIRRATNPDPTQRPDLAEFVGQLWHVEMQGGSPPTELTSAGAPSAPRILNRPGIATHTPSINQTSGGYGAGAAGERASTAAIAKDTTTSFSAHLMPDADSAPRPSSDPTETRAGDNDSANDGPRPRRSRRALLIGGAAMLVIAVGVGAYFAARDPKPIVPTAPTRTTPTSSAITTGLTPRPARPTDVRLDPVSSSSNKWELTWDPGPSSSEHRSLFTLYRTVREHDPLTGAETSVLSEGFVLRSGDVIEDPSRSNEQLLSTGEPSVVITTNASDFVNLTCYTIVAINESNEQIQSDSSACLPDGPPDQPTIDRAGEVVAAGEIILKWSPEGHPAVAHYRVLVTDALSGELVSTQVLEPASTSKRMTAEPGQCFTVVAENAFNLTAPETGTPASIPDGADDPVCAA